MKTALKTLALVAALAVTPAWAPAHAAEQAAPLIERSKLFGNPSRSGAQLSPDGQWLSWLAPRDGEPGPDWMEKDGAATAVSLALIMAATIGVGLLIKALAG